MKKIVILLSIIFVFLFFNQAWAQSREKLPAVIGFVSRSTPDSIVLRWLVDDVNLFNNGFTNGYIIERADENDGSWTEFKTVATVKAWPLKQWNDRLSILRDTTQNSYKNFKTAYELLMNTSKKADIDMSDSDAVVEAQTESELEYLFTVIVSCMDIYAADAMALRWVDHNVKEGENYKYRISFADASLYSKYSATEVEAKAETYVSKSKPMIKTIENESSIIMNWILGEEPIIGYSLERSQDNGKNFQRLNKSIVILNEEYDENGNDIATVVDTTVVLYTPYLYRLIGHTLFADEIEIGQVKAMARDRTPANAIFVPNPEPTSGEKAVIEWRMTAKMPDLKGFNVRRDSEREGDFNLKLNESLIPSDKLQFTDENPDPEGTSYYVVETVDTAGNIFRSNPVLLVLIDSFPPSKPVWSMGTIDSTGAVTLVLHINKEKDFMGYRLLRANQEDHEFSVFYESYKRDYFVQGTDSVFLDTISLNSLTGHVFYKAVALDFHYNQSKPSEALKLVRPDTIRPMPPILKKLLISDTAISLVIVPSASKDVGVIKIYRKSAADTAWVAFDEVSAKERTYNDFQVTPGQKYEYRLTAVDTNDLVSNFSFSLSGIPYFPSTIDAIRNFKAEYDSDAKQVFITWDCIPLKHNYDQVTSFVIYRAKGDAKPERYHSIIYNKQGFFYMDDDISVGSSYTYSIKAITKRGAESLLLPFQIVKIP
jgi:uncharacterized protein